MKSWHRLVLKFIAEGEDSLGREKGEQLWPERFTGDKVEEIRSTLGTYFFTGLYQQEPPEQENAMFKREWIRYYKEVSEFIIANRQNKLKSAMAHYVIVDPAFSENEGADYTAMMHLYIDNESNIYIDEVYRARLNAGKLIKAIANFIDKHQPQATYIEGFSAQTIIYEELKKGGYIISDIKSYLKKEVRAIPASVKFENGMVFLKKADWNLNFEKELLAFPSGKHDDQVDCLSYAVTLRTSSGEMPRGRRNKINLLDI